MLVYGHQEQGTLNNQLPEDKEIKFMEENVKIAKIKKSCSVGKKVSVILCIICIVGTVLALAGGIIIFSMGKKFDNEMEQAIEEGYISTGSSIGSSNFVHFETFDVSNLHSDIPAWQAAIDDHPYAISYGATCLSIAGITALVAVLMKLMSGTFQLIIKEDSPFTDKVIKRVVIVMIIVSAALFFTTGMAFGALGGIVTWVVYSIMDYGKTLQIQSDETL